ncbi:hypothetical protein SteCoe_27043 [Stentor coeruleus]|uniref:Cilia- and flagella-associated protein 36 n=1 Tax=Stentor coeruleus TaxID=5963 RepID=A0A1R2BBG8_9CILI|nr:hypothetical protein SteCoe_27043 [Stentor coeruleus]
MAKEAPIDWLYDYTLQFLASPGWKIPIMSFIDEKCYAFDGEEENKLEYTTIHKEFQDMIDLLLENMCIELGASHEMFFRVVKAGLKNPTHRKYFEQVLATLNFMSFKKLMVKRNKELELEALQMMHTEGHANMEEVIKATSNKDQAEIEHAIAVSIAAEAERNRIQQEEEEMIRKAIEESESEYKRKLEEEKVRQAEIIREIQRKEAEKVAKMKEEQKRVYEEQKRKEIDQKRKEEEEFKRQEELRAQNKRLEDEMRRKMEEETKRLEAMRLEESKAQAKKIEEEAKKRESERNLPPVHLKKDANVDMSQFHKIDVTSELKVSEDLDEMNKKIAAKYSEKKVEENKGESLEQRTARLKMQRELLLKKKQEERANEMKNYVNNGGTDLSVKKDLGPLPPVISQDELEKRRNVVNKLRAAEH